MIIYYTIFSMKTLSSLSSFSSSSLSSVLWESGTKTDNEARNDRPKSKSKKHDEWRVVDWIGLNCTETKPRNNKITFAIYLQKVDKGRKADGIYIQRQMRTQKISQKNSFQQWIFLNFFSESLTESMVRSCLSRN